MDKYERGKERVSFSHVPHRGDGGTSCVFSFLFITFIYLREIHVPPCTYWSQRTTYRNRFSLLPRSSGIKLRSSTLAASAWAAELSQGPSSGLLSWCLCASTRMLPFHPLSSSRIHCLAMPSVKPIHFAPYFSFYGFQSCDFQRCEVLCLTSGFVSNALPTSSSSPYSTIHVGFTHVHSTLYMCYIHVYQMPSN